VAALGSHRRVGSLVCGHGLVIFRLHPDLLAERLSPPKGAKGWDRTIMSILRLTQLARYIEHMKLPIRGARLVQYSPYALAAGPSGGALTAIAGNIDTHLFLNGEAPDATHANLLMIAARTCYLHATAAAVLPPRLCLVHNGVRVI